MRSFGSAGEKGTHVTAHRFRTRKARLLIALAAATALALTLGAGVAYAQDVPDEDQVASFEEIFVQLQDTPVYKDACTKTCHGNIAKTKNYSSAIIFQHGYHQLVSCSACHPRFPHRADATIERPTMKGCFDCHGLRHGPMGEIATDACEDCHVTPKERLRPAFHTWDWRGTPHVKPAEEAFNTRCAMCHDQASCDDCHEDEGVEWAPASWDYDAGDGCLSCHGNAELKKQTAAGSESFKVEGVELSVHQDVTCQQCHPDYRYDDDKPATNLWTINAGQACADCHEGSEDEASRQAVAEYDKSIHAEAVAEGNYDSATCSSCHGGHYIYDLDTAVGAQRMHSSAYRVCARCKQHGDEYDTYDDYYHGRAYKTGAPDAPACWECHESHYILPSSDPESSVSSQNVGATCGQEGCHKGSTEEFGTEAASLIHTKSEETQNNPILRLVSQVRGWAGQ